MERLRLAELGDVARIMEIMEAAHDAMEDPSRYCTDPADYVARHVKDQGFILLAEAAGEIAGFFMVVLPGFVEGNTGYSLPFPPEIVAETAILDSVAVHPEHQGQGIMEALLRAALGMLEPVSHVQAATVSPDNGPSLHTFLKCGFRPYETIKKPGGETRYLMVRGLPEP